MLKKKVAEEDVEKMSNECLCERVKNEIFENMFKGRCQCDESIFGLQSHNIKPRNARSRSIIRGPDGKRSHKDTKYKP